MARIRRTDIDEVRARTNIDDVVGEYVTLKSAGVGSRKGLCPFHDERTPSFHVRPQLGFYHCFGCGESGDVFSFLQKMDHISFVEAVERLAGRLGYQLTYEDGGEAPDHSNRVRLLQVNAEAEKFFQAQLATADAQVGRDFLGGRGFDPQAAAHFGVDHIKILRRIMDDESNRGRVIFNFDPDEAGRKAAMRAFAEENRFVAQTFVAVDTTHEGLDPCDLRLKHGDAAIVSLIDHAVPMYEFVVREQIKRHNLRNAEGRVAALREAAPIIASIRDRALRPEYVRQLSGWLGMDLEQVQREVRRHEQAANAPSDPRGDPSGIADNTYAMPVVRMRDLPNDPITRLERDALSAVLQYPKMLSEVQLDGVLAASFSDASLDTVRNAIVATRGTLGTPQWLPEVHEEVPSSFVPLVTDLSMAPLPAGPGPEQVAAYVRSVTAALIERDLLRRKAELLGELKRTDIETDPLGHRELSEQLVEVERRKRELRESVEA
jgi:DNA primase